jgi:nitrogen fixation NifU-like protein
MSLEDELYKEIILDNYKSKKNKMKLEDAELHQEGANPSCGDDLELYMKTDGDTVVAVTYEGMGCSICCASANLLCETFRGRSIEEVRSILGQYRGMLLEDQEPDFPDEVSDLEAMQGVKNYPVRIKCALLAWNTAQNMLDEAYPASGSTE